MVLIEWRDLGVVLTGYKRLETTARERRDVEIIVPRLRRTLDVMVTDRTARKEGEQELDRKRGFSFHGCRSASFHLYSVK